MGKHEEMQIDGIKHYVHTGQKHTNGSWTYQIVGLKHWHRGFYENGHHTIIFTNGSQTCMLNGYYKEPKVAALFEKLKTSDLNTLLTDYWSFYPEYLGSKSKPYDSIINLSFFTPMLDKNIQAVQASGNSISFSQMTNSTNPTYPTQKRLIDITNYFDSPCALSV